MDCDIMKKIESKKSRKVDERKFSKKDYKALEEIVLGLADALGDVPVPVISSFNKDLVELTKMAYEYTRKMEVS